MYFCIFDWSRKHAIQKKQKFRTDQKLISNLKEVLYRHLSQYPSISAPKVLPLPFQNFNTSQYKYKNICFLPILHTWSRKIKDYRWAPMNAIYCKVVFKKSPNTLPRPWSICSWQKPFLLMVISGRAWMGQLTFVI